MLINDIFRLIYTRSSPPSHPHLGPDERQDVQQKTFTKWINHHLTKGKYEPIKSLFDDLRDGHKLLALLEVLTNKKYVSHLMTMNF
jgi:Calponin homology (CH) domain